jgi:nucleoside-diphosphate-sugar epimerase
MDAIRAGILFRTCSHIGYTPPMLVAITGATGFIGSYTVAALKRRGHEVRALVRRTSRRDHIAASVDQWTIGELQDPQAQAGLVAGAEVVIHAAVDWNAQATSPAIGFSRNVLPSLQLLEAARLAGVQQFIFVSSVAVYDQILQDRKLDEKHPTWPASLYGAYKAAVEPHLKAYHAQFGMNTSSWRPAAVYGIDPNLPRSQWYELIRAVKEGRPVATGQGGKITHVQDVADALADACGDAQVAGQFYNLVDRHLYWQLAAEFAREAISSASVIEDRKGTGPRNQFDTADAIAFFESHGTHMALRRGAEGVRQYVTELLARLA